jgi:hypothetical protein
MNAKRFVIAICGMGAIVLSIWLTAGTSTAFDSPVSPFAEPRAEDYEQRYILFPLILGGE